MKLTSLNDSRTDSRADAASDADVLARVAQGDVAALGELYDRYASGMLRFVQRVEPNDAEDVVQTVFLRVMRIAHTFRSDAPSARPWLWAITARVLQERSRALRRLGAMLFRFASSGERVQPSALDLNADVARGLSQLSVAKRNVLILAEVEGFGCEEIADMLSIPVGTVWTRLHHARRELRRFHEHEEAEG